MSTPWERLREERQRLGMSQEAFGACGGVRKQAQLKYEKGDRKPDGEYFVRIAEAGADVDYILTGTPPAVRAHLTAIEASSKAVQAVELPQRESQLVQALLYGMTMRNTALVMKELDDYVAERAAPAKPKKGAK